MLHFLILGGALFLIFAVLRTGDDDSSASSDRRTGEQAEPITVRAPQLEHLAEEKARRLNRPLTSQEFEEAREMARLEAVLFHEALRRGLDEQDEVIRQHLINKMRTLLEDFTLPDPTRAELEAFYRKHQHLYTRPATLNLELLSFPPDAALPDDLLAQLNSGEAHPRQFGEKLPGLPAGRLTQMTHFELAEVFQSFSLATRLFDEDQTPAGTWTGPVESPLGLHFIRVLRRYPALTLPMAGLHEQVELDWHEARQREIIAEKIGQLIQERGYIVELPDAGEIELFADPND